MKTILTGDRMGGVLFDVQQERYRQVELHKQGKFPFVCEDPTIPDSAKLSVLAEEFGEASREVNEMVQVVYRQYPGEQPEVIRDSAQRAITRRKALLRAELIQIAAVCVAWCEALDAQEEARAAGKNVEHLSEKDEDWWKDRAPSRRFLSQTAQTVGHMSKVNPGITFLSKDVIESFIKQPALNVTERHGQPLETIRKWMAKEILFWRGYKSNGGYVDGYTRGVEDGRLIERGNPGIRGDFSHLGCTGTLIHSEYVSCPVHDGTTPLGRTAVTNADNGEQVVYDIIAKRNRTQGNENGCQCLHPEYNPQYKPKDARGVRVCVKCAKEIA